MDCFTFIGDTATESLSVELAQPQSFLSFTFSNMQEVNSMSAQFELSCMFVVFTVNGIGRLSFSLRLKTHQKRDLKKKRQCKSERNSCNMPVLENVCLLAWKQFNTVRDFMNETGTRRKSNIYIQILCVCSHCRCNEFSMKWINVCAYKVKTMCFQYPIYCLFLCTLMKYFNRIYAL